MKPLTLSLFSAALASLALVGCKGGGGSGGGDSIATVNADPVSVDEFHKYLERKPIVQVIGEDGQPKELQVAGSLGFQAMRDLINRRVLLQVAKDDKVYPTDAEVKAELEFQTKRRPDFIKQLQAQGLTIEDIKRDLTLDLAKEKIVTKGITVTAKDADDFIAKNPERFMTPEQARLRVIVLKDASKKAQVDKDLASGRQFGQVAVQYSDAPNVRQTQGQYGITNVPQMDPAIQEIVKNTPELKTSDWKQFGQEWVKFYVDRKEKAKKVNIDATLKEAVRRGIAMDRGSAATDLSKRLVDKLKMSKIEVKPANLKAPWDQAFKTLQESDVNAKTGTGTGATSGARATTAGGG